MMTQISGLSLFSGSYGEANNSVIQIFASFVIEYIMITQVSGFSVFFSGRDGEVNAESRAKLPYVDAVLHEIMRIRTVVPNGVFHENNKDIKLGGYNCAKVISKINITKYLGRTVMSFKPSQRVCRIEI